jgi:putative DNA methylase
MTSCGAERQGTPPPKGWYRRGERHPPHFDGGAIPQFVTFRLAGTLPRAKLANWKDELKLNRISDQEFHSRIEAYLDAASGACWMKQPRIADVVQNALLHFDAERYALHGWVVMPNHVHVMITPAAGRRLPDLVHSWKSFTAKESNKALKRIEAFWEGDFFDRYVRNLEHFERTMWYMANNPVAAQHCSQPEDWPWSHVGLWSRGSGASPD